MRVRVPPSSIVLSGPPEVPPRLAGGSARPPPPPLGQTLRPRPSPTPPRSGPLDFIWAVPDGFSPSGTDLDGAGPTPQVNPCVLVPAPKAPGFRRAGGAFRSLHPGMYQVYKSMRAPGRIRTSGPPVPALRALRSTVLLPSPAGIPGPDGEAFAASTTRSSAFYGGRGGEEEGLGGK